MGSDKSEEERSHRNKHRRSSNEDDVAASKRRKHRKHRHKHEVAEETVVSDLEEGEIVEEPILGIHSAHAEVGNRSRCLLEDNGNDSEDLVKNDRLTVEEDLTDVSRSCSRGVSQQTLSYGNYSNGDIGLVLLKENYNVSKEKVPYVISRRERSNNDNSIDSKTRSKLLSSQGEDGDIHGRYLEDVRSRSRSHSRGRGRERSKSVSLSERVSPMKRPHKKEVTCSRDANKTITDSGDEIMAVCKWDSEHGYRDFDNHNDGGRSGSYSRCRQLDSRQIRESRNSERETSREKDHDGKDMGSRWRREKREEDGGEINRETGRLRDSGRHTERKYSRERGRERDGESDRERERTRGREERELEREREWMKDRELERIKKIGRYKNRDRESYGDRRSGRSRSRDRESYEDRESRRNIDDDRFNKNPNYEKKHPDDYDDGHLYKQSRSFRDETDSKYQSKKNNENKSRRDEEEQEEYRERVALQLVDQEEDDLDRIKEESRKRRQAILDKYKIQQQQLHKPQLENDGKEHVGQVSQEVVVASVASKPFMARNEKDVGTIADPSFVVSKVLTQFGVSASDRTSGAGGLGEGTPKSETSGDMFCDDIFGDSPAGVRKTGKGDGFAIERGRSLHDNWDDAEGYYSFRLGEVLDGRYEVAAAHGKGVFSTVVRAKDLKPGPADPEEVAIKIIRNNEHMHKAGKEELVILKKLVGADPDNKRHCVRFLSSFKYRNHLCLVFESLNMNLREVLKKFGRNIGLKLTAVRLYSKQLFIALKHLRNCGVLHSDIKPDNMLVNEAKNVLKLCDFGNAMFAGKNEITPYLVSRFYRSPEIILGLPYDHPLDIWSVGCCIFELYSGKVLFPGATNNDMLRLHMELKGLFPKKMLRKGAFTDQHFDQDLNFLAIEEDPVTKKTMRRVITSIKPKDIGAIITGSPGDEDPKMLANFKDLLEKIFILDPDKRLTVSQALKHPFITELRGWLVRWKFKDMFDMRGFLAFRGIFSVSIGSCQAYEPTSSALDALKALWIRSL